MYMTDKIPDGGEMPPAEPYAAVGMSSEVEIAYKALHALCLKAFTGIRNANRRKQRHRR